MDARTLQSKLNRLKGDYRAAQRRGAVKWMARIEREMDETRHALDAATGQATLFGHTQGAKS